MKFALFLIISLFYLQNYLYAQEIVHFHTDRPAYFPGDTIWYKSYFIHDDRLDTAVKNMSLNIGTANENIIEDQLRPIHKGISFGQFIIPRDFKENELYFNLFTKRNVINSEVNDPMEFKIGVFQNNQISSTKRPQVRCYVEGAGILKNSYNKIKFEWNLRECINAYIKDETGNIIRSITTDSLGRSDVEIFAPKEKLFLHWEYESEKYIDTIPVSENLVRLSLKDREGGTYLFLDNQIGSRDLKLEFKIEEYRMLDTMLSFEKSGSDSLQIDNLLKGRFYGYFSVFDNGNRLAYLKVNQTTDLNPVLVSDSIQFKKFESNAFNLSFESRSFWNGSITVYDGNLPAPINLSYESEGFKSFNTRNFKYTYIDDNLDYQEPKEIIDSVFALRGVIEMKGKKWEKFREIKKKREIKLKGKKEEMRLMSFGYRLLTEPNYSYREIDFDSEGNLNLPKLTYYDTLETRFVQIDDRLKLIDYDVKLKFSNLPKLHKLKISSYLLGQDISQKYKGRYNPDYYQHEFGNSELKEVQITNRIDARKLMLRKKYSEGWFLNHDSFIEIDLLNYDLPSWITTLKELKDHLYHKYPKLRSIQAEFLVNNRHNYQGGELPMHVSEIEYIRIYEKYIHNKMGGGAIMFYTSGVDSRNKDIGTSKIRIEKVSGYSSFLDYYLPTYGAQNRPKYDDRQTLFWAADQSLEGGIKNNFKFFNNSISNSYYIHMNMISEGGSFISLWKKVME